MKTLLLIFFSMYFANEHPPKNEEETFYYFCYSRSIPPADSINREVILYTEIKTVTCEKEYFSTLSSNWYKFVEKDCGNSKGCTSDLNYYPIFEVADSRLKKKLDQYSNEARYQIKKVDF